MGLRNLPDRLRAAPMSRLTVQPKRADPVYLTPAYREWREAVIARAGGVCQERGCGRREPRMFADHIVELKDGGARHDVANGQCLCGKHHSLKTSAARMGRLGAKG